MGYIHMTAEEAAHETQVIERAMWLYKTDRACFDYVETVMWLEVTLNPGECNDPYLEANR